MRGIVESFMGRRCAACRGSTSVARTAAPRREFRYGGDVVMSSTTGRATRHSPSSHHRTRHARRTKCRPCPNTPCARIASNYLDAAECVRALNRLCIENSAFEGDVEFFATLFFAIVQPDRCTMEYVSAGTMRPTSFGRAKRRCWARPVRS